MFSNKILILTFLRYNVTFTLLAAMFCSNISLTLMDLFIRYSKYVCVTYLQ
jgi:hypothetical protein